MVDLAVDKVKDKYGKYPFVNELMDELKDPLNELVHREVGQETIDKVRVGGIIAFITSNISL